MSKMICWTMKLRCWSEILKEGDLDHLSRQELREEEIKLKTARTEVSVLSELDPIVLSQVFPIKKLPLGF